MTPLDSKLRLTIYVLIAMVSAAMTGLMSVDFTDAKQVVLFVLGVIIAGLNTLRSYIDKSASQVEQPKDKP